MLQVENLRKQYPGFQLDLTMEVPAGRITGLVGPNGSGKSTAFKAIMKLNQPESGRVTLLGKTMSAAEADLDAAFKEQIGVVFADSGFSGYITLKDVGAILKSMYHQFDEQRFSDYCHRMGLPSGKKVKDFSTGMKAKLKVAAALSHNADFLILDEPTAGMDVMARDEMLTLLREYMEEKEERSILISSHISSDLEGICDDLYMMKNGSVVFHEEVNALQDTYGVLKMTEEEFSKLDKEYLLRWKEEPYGYRCLTGERQFYLENYPNIMVEKGTLDDMILLMLTGEGR